MKNNKITQENNIDHSNVLISSLNSSCSELKIIPDLNPSRALQDVDMNDEKFVSDLGKSEFHSK